MILWLFARLPGRVLSRLRRPATAPAQKTPPDSALRGLRFQLLQALELLERGQMAIVIAERAGDSRSARQRAPGIKPEKRAPERLLALMVPGTMHPAPVGRALLKLGWIEPSARRHWVPWLRFFEISDSGRRNLLRARNWWSELGPIEKLAAMVRE